MIQLVYLTILATGLDHRFLAGEEGLLSISLGEACAYACLAFLVLEELSRWRMGIRDRFATQRGAWWPVRIYCIWIVVAAAAVWGLRGSTDGLHALKDTTPAIILYIATVHWARTEQELRGVVRVVLVMLALVSLLGLAQHLFGGPYLNPILDNAFEKFRITGDARVDKPTVGTFGTPNAFAVFMAPLLMLCLGTVSAGERDGRPRLLQGEWLLLALTVAALLATQAKLVIGCFALCTVWLVLTRVLRKPASLGFLLVFCALSLASLGIGFALLGYLEASLPLGLTLGTLWGRLGLAAEAVYLLGVDLGIATWGGGLSSYQAGMPASYGVHVEYLNQALMWGVPGALLFVFMVAGALGRPGILGWSTKLALLCACLTLFFESAAGNQRIAMLFLLLGVNEASKRIMEGRKNSP